MNIKHAIGRLLGVKDSMVNKGWEDTVTFKELKYILEGLDEPMPTNTQGLASYLDGKMISMQMDEINKLKADLAIANSRVKNLEEQNIHLSNKLSKKQNNPFSYLSCKFCDGTGIERPFGDILLWGRKLFTIRKMMDYAEATGYKEK